MTDLFPTLTYGSLDLTAAPYLWEFGGDFGAPENASEVILSALQDGDIEVSDRAGNRTISLTILVEGSDLGALAEAEAALELECRKDRNELTIDPGDGYAVPTVFDTFRAQLTLVRDDDHERNTLRRYSLVMRALPHGRSEDEQTITPTPTSIGTARQKSYEFDVAGSARTEALVRVSGTASGLGPTLLYTRPGVAGMIPLRPWIAGSSTADATRVFGSYIADITAPGVTALVDKTAVPDGTYIVLALVRSDSGSGSTTLTATASTLINSGYNVRAESSSSSTVALTTTYSLVQVGGAVQIPAAVLGSEGPAVVKVVLSDVAGGLTVRLDEAWLVEIGSGDLTWVSTGVDGAGMNQAKSVRVDPPTTDRPYSRVLRSEIGVGTDWSDSFGATVFAWGQHVLAPGTNTAFVVTAEDATSVLDLVAPKQWHTHAGS